MSDEDNSHKNKSPFRVISGDNPEPASQETVTRGANDEAILLRITDLEQDHRDLNLAIAAMESQQRFDRLSIARLKKKKLQLKDKIEKLKNSTTPDIIA